MKSVRKTILLSALLTCGMTAAMATAVAATNDPTTGAGDGVNRPMHSHGSPGHGMPRANVDGPFLHAIQRLNLTAEQKATIHGYLETAKQRDRANNAQTNVDALANPGDPNYLSAIAAAKNAAAARIQQRSDLQVQIYGSLTPEQQVKLPQVLAEMKAQQQQHRADWEQHRQQSGASPSASK